MRLDSLDVLPGLGGVVDEGIAVIHAAHEVGHGLARVEIGAQLLGRLLDREPTQERRAGASGLAAREHEGAVDLGGEEGRVESRHLDCELDQDGE